MTSETHASTQAAEHQGGLPQLNVNDFAPQLVWLAISFGTLYWIMSRIALPRIAGVIEKRRDRIAGDLDAARTFKHQAEAAEVAYKSDLATAKDKAQSIASATKDRLNTQTEAKQAEVDKQINARLLEAEQRITSAKKVALKEINAVATTTTSEILQHLVGQKYSDQDLAAAIKTATH
ncbi:MAG: ATP F0F1 synthase subunit B [Hyphomicrobiaceae bacterium]|nr:ATP F0F1 synthase subunit B [Hyphomicrobiaceae bacterium]